ncbi:MAG TPA: alanine--glyoxylate aminotransferase family protein, partial [Pseudonocardiaceae bacterium]|nr:alanine--glyoxylate aminotransferase family protein [Pseudonocardiaceae bacterium]
PSNPYPEAVEALARPALGHLDPEFLTLVADTADRLRTVFGTRNRLTLPVSGTGSAGMEACLASLLEPGELAIIGVNGYFGERLCEVTRRLGAQVQAVHTQWAPALDPEQLLDAQRKAPQARLVAVVHAETSTGVRNQIAPLCELQDTDTLLLVDTVTSLGGIPVEVDAWGVDACYSATQKCLGAPSGIAPVTLSDRAVARIRDRDQPVASFYLDLGLLAGYYQGEPPRYHHTASSTLISAVHAGLGRLLEEGLTATWERHARIGEQLQAALPDLGFELLAEQGHRLPQLTAARLPERLSDATARRTLREEYGIEVGAGLGPLAGTGWRIGLMGHNACDRPLSTLLGALANL